MFKVGDYVAHYKQGVCEVVAIGKIDISCSDQQKDYYTLQPIYDSGGTLYTPVDNLRNQIREVTKKEAMTELISSIEEIPMIEVSIEKRREASYKEAMLKNQCDAWISIMKTACFRRKQRYAAGKKAINLDERYLAIAETFLYGEMAAALDITREQSRADIKKIFETVI